MTDEILKEMHAIKDANGRKYRAGFAGMMRDLRQRQEQSGRRIIRASQPASQDPQGCRGIIIMWARPAAGNLNRLQFVTDWLPYSLARRCFSTFQSFLAA